MTAWALRRVALLVPTVAAASLVVFVALRALPGDAALAILADTPHTLEIREALRVQLGLEEPLARQYLRWAAGMLSGDFGGRSLVSGEPIRAIVAGELGVTLLLACYATLLAAAVAIPLSVVAASRPGGVVDRAVGAVSLGGLSVPAVFTSLLVLWLLLRLLRWSPPIIYSGPTEDLRDHVEMMVWPTVVLAAGLAGQLVRVTRRRLVSLFDSDFVTAAHARGLSRGAVVLRHALPNALIALVTMIGLQFGSVIGGALVVETVFGLPGLGRGVVQAALARDYPLVQTSVTLLVGLVLLANVAVDLLYAAIDPRVSSGRRAP